MRTIREIEEDLEFYMMKLTLTQVSSHPDPEELKEIRDEIANLKTELDEAISSY